MPNWRKVITSGSDAILNEITSSGGIDTPDITIDGWGSVSASLSTLTSAGGYSVTNESDNRILTSAGSNIGNAEANLTFDGSVLSTPGFEFSSVSHSSTSTSYSRILGDNTLITSEDNLTFFNAIAGNTIIARNASGSAAYSIGNFQLAHDNVIMGSSNSLLIGLNVPSDRNIIIGSSGGAVIANGDDNIYIGSGNELHANSGNTQKVIAIGSGSRATYTGTLTNAVGIGNGVELTQDNTMVFGSTGSLAVNVGIGTNEPAAKLHVSGSTMLNGSVDIYKSGSTVFTTEGSQGTLFSVTDELSGSLFSVNDISGIPILEVFSDDTVKIGTYNSEGIEVQGSDVKITGSLAVGNISPNATDGRIDASNDIVAYSSSDKRWKTNIKPIESPLEKLQKLSGVEFDWIEDFRAHGNSGNDIGVIAQEVEEVLPQVVQTRDSGMKAVRYEKLIPLLIETIKEQQQQIDKLKNKIG